MVGIRKSLDMKHKKKHKKKEDWSDVERRISWQSLICSAVALKAMYSVPTYGSAISGAGLPQPKLPTVPRYVSIFGSIRYLSI
jgi:hypothetical protein